ncbi:MAG: hypothetical protein ABJN62_09680 [Halioglobus sp.]
MNTEYNTAVQAYLDQRGEGANIPNQNLSYFTNGVWYFHNVNGFLGKLSSRTGKLFGAWEVSQ